MGYLSPENLNHLLIGNAETNLSIQKQREVLSLKVEPIIKEGVNSGIIKPNDDISLISDDTLRYLPTIAPATYEIIDSINDKTKQPIVFMLIKYGKKIEDDCYEITVEKSQMRISVEGNHLVFIKNDDIDHPLCVSINTEQSKDIILQIFKNQNYFNQTI